LETEQKLKARGNAALQNHRDKYAKANASHAAPRGGGAGVEGDLPKAGGTESTGGGGLRKFLEFVSRRGNTF
jgi:hypothetical protein